MQHRPNQAGSMTLDTDCGDPAAWHKQNACCTARRTFNNRRYLPESLNKDTFDDVNVSRFGEDISVDEKINLRVESAERWVLFKLWLKLRC